MHAVLLAALHELCVTDRVGGDDDDCLMYHKLLPAWMSQSKTLTLSLERDVDILEHLHRVRTAPLLLGVEQDVALLRDRALDHVEEHGPERALHVRADPDQEPVVELHRRREHRADAGARADRDAAPEEVREVGQPGELCDRASAGEARVT